MNRNSFLQLLAGVMTFALTLTGAFAQGTAFTYQGRLDIAGAPASGSNDLTFTLYDAVTAGATVGTSNTVNDLVITNGLFTVTLDFGAGAFNGAARWLQIAARPGVSTGAYTNLAPRQPITPAPYAVFAGGAAGAGVTGTLPASALAGVYSGSVNLSNAANSFAGNGSALTSLNASNLTSGTVADARLSANVALRNGGNTFNGNQFFTNGNVGIGTSSPLAPLHVNGGIAARSTSLTKGFATMQPGDVGYAGYLEIFGTNAVRRGFLGYNSGVNLGLENGSSFNITGGNVGIGTAAPDNLLTVGGNVNQQGMSLVASAGDPFIRFEDYNGGSFASKADIYWSRANNVLAFNSGGQSASFGGRVGIGTTTPNFPLSFANTGGEKISLYGQDTNSLHGIGIGGSRMEFYVPTTGHNFDFGVGNNANFSPKMRISGNGNVGIGTTAPAYGLHVQDPGAQTGRIQVGGTSPDGTRKIISFGDGDYVTIGENGADDRMELTAGTFAFSSRYAGAGPALEIRSGELNGVPDTNAVTLEMAGNKKLGVWDDLVVSGEVTCTAVNLTSDRNAKEQFKPVDVRKVLDKVARLPISEWQYKTAGDARHVGPMAQDFREAFALGHDDKHISTVDEGGVALAAIQGLNEIVQEKNEELSRLKKENQSLAERLAAIERALARRVESKP